MEITKRLVGSIGLSLLLTTMAYSDSEVTKSVEVFEADWYVGAKAGWGYYQDGCESWANECDDNSPAGGIFVGHKILPWLTAELGYTYLGEAVAQYPSAEVTGEMQSADLFLRALMPLSERYGLYGKAGLVYFLASTESSVGSSSSDGADLGMGGGFYYKLNENWITQVEYQFIDGLGDSVVGQSDHHLMTIGLVYAFGSSKERITFNTTSETEDKVTVFQSTLNDSLFEFDSDEIKDASVLQPFVNRLKENPQAEIVVVGHTDNLGSVEYNQKLSERRANAVKEYFVSQGIDAYRIKSYGLGETFPVAPNDTKEGRTKNRRVELTSPGFETHLRN